MYIDKATGKGQCKTDNVWTGTECSVIGKGYAWREERSGDWEAGFFPFGYCDSVRPDLKRATCMLFY